MPIIRALIIATIAVALQLAGCGSKSSSSSGADGAQQQGDTSTTLDTTNGKDSVPSVDLFFPDLAGGSDLVDVSGSEDLTSGDLGLDVTADSILPDLVGDIDAPSDVATIDTVDVSGPLDAKDTSVADLNVGPDVLDLDVPTADTATGFNPAHWAQCKSSADCKVISVDSTCNTLFPGGQCSCGGANASAACNQLGGGGVTFICTVIGFCLPEPDSEDRCPDWLAPAKTYEIGMDSLTPVCATRTCNPEADDCAPYKCAASTQGGTDYRCR